MRTAKVIPLKRLPKGLDFFDYALGDYSDELSAGHLVQIPWRSGEALGIVYAFTEGGQKDAKNILRLLNPAPLLSQRELEFLYFFSRLYGVSLCTMVKMALPPLQKRKLAGAVFTLPAEYAKKMPAQKDDYIVYCNPAEREAMYLEHARDKTLIVVPEVRHIDETLSALPENIRNSALVWHSALSQKEQFDAWLRVRSGEKSVVVGTRSSVFLPFSRLLRIIIDYEHDDNLKHWDQYPRYHVFDVCTMLARRMGARVLYASFSPSLTGWPNFLSAGARLIRPANLPTLISITREHGAPAAALSHIVLSKLESLAENQTALIIAGRKGFATSLLCSACGAVELCPQTGLPLVYHKDAHLLQSPYSLYSKPVPSACAACGSPLLRFSGFGAERVADEIAKNLPELAKRILYVDSKHCPPADGVPAGAVIVGTRAALACVPWDSLAIAVHLDTDRALALPEFTAGEELLHLIAEISYRMPASGRIFLQTHNPDNKFFAQLARPASFYDAELQVRRMLFLPPFSILVKYIISDISEEKVAGASQTLYDLLLPKLTKVSPRSILQYPFEAHLRVYRGKYTRILLAKMPVSDAYSEALADLHAGLPRQVKIDVRPISVIQA